MTVSILYMFAIGLMIVLGAIAMFIWGASTGAFDKTEDIKYIVFRDEEDD